MKYTLIDYRGGDLFTKEFSSMEEAINVGENDWSHLTSQEKNKCIDFYILESVNPDEWAEDHFDGDIIKRWCNRDRKRKL